jgi:chromosome segregation ATPase
LAAQQQEADRLRGVVEEYVEQIDANQLDQGDDEVSALQLELTMVREQAVKDVAAMREELARNATALTRLQASGGEEVVAHEAMRQEIGELQKSLQERQRELNGEEQARQMLEDALEDANTEIDDLRRKLDALAVDVEEAQFGRLEAEDARTQVQAALYRHQEEAEEARATDLRDERLGPDPGRLGLNGPGRIGTATAWLLGPLIGAALVMGGLEIWSHLNGHGEFVRYLLGR